MKNIHNIVTNQKNIYKTSKQNCILSQCFEQNEINNEATRSNYISTTSKVLLKPLYD